MAATPVPGTYGTLHRFGAAFIVPPALTQPARFGRLTTGRLRPCRRVSRTIARADLDQFNSPRIRLDDLEFEPALMADDLAPGRHSSRHFEYQAGESLGLLIFFTGEEIDAKQILERLKIDAAIG